MLEHILSDGQLPCLRAMLLDENASDGENDLELPVDTNHGHEGRPDEGEFPICGADARVGDVIFALALGGTGTSAMTSSTRSHASASEECRVPVRCASAERLPVEFAFLDCRKFSL